MSYTIEINIKKNLSEFSLEKNKILYNGKEYTLENFLEIYKMIKVNNNSIISIFDSIINNLIYLNNNTGDNNICNTYYYNDDIRTLKQYIINEDIIPSSTLVLTDNLEIEEPIVNSGRYKYKDNFRDYSLYGKNSTILVDNLEIEEPILLVIDEQE